jgi:hypothetical protein
MKVTWHLLLSVLSNAVALWIGQKSDAVELDFPRCGFAGEVFHPERANCLLTLYRKRREVGALKASQAERNVAQRKHMLLTQMVGELAGVRRVCEGTCEYEAVGTVIFEEVAHNDESAVASLGQGSKFLARGVECTEDVGSGLMRIK